MSDSKLKSPPLSCLQLFWIFFKIGSTAFGGFMALISVVEQLVVQKKKLLSSNDMIDGITLASMLPGPVAVNSVAYAGYRIRGLKGALAGVTGVVLPSFLLIVLVSYAYFKWGEMPIVDKAFMGFVPAVTVIIFKTAWGMGKKHIKLTSQRIITVCSIAIMIGFGNVFTPFSIIIGGGLLGLFLNRNSLELPRFGKWKPVFGRSPLSIVALAPLLVLNIGTLSKLFFTFAAMSLALFGGGYVFVPMMQNIVVAGEGWLTHKEFLDAIALGQVTPGPILISAAFIGYKVAGFMGALVATIGIFLPSVLLMLFCSRWFGVIKDSKFVKSVLFGVRPAVVGMIFSAVWIVGRSLEMHWGTLVILVFAIVALLRLKLEVVWTIPICGVLGLLLF